MSPRIPLAAIAVAATVLLAPAGAAQADPAPFGHACSPANGVRFCPTTDLASRPASFDGYDSLIGVAFSAAFPSFS